MTRRNQVQIFRFTEDEVKRLKDSYQKTRFSSLSAFVRYLLFNRNIEIKFSPTEEQLARAISEHNRKLRDINNQMAKIGVNINQVAKKVNAQQYVMREDMNLILQRFDDLKSIIDNFSMLNKNES